MDKSNLICPFCNENDFDAIGLKHHLLSGHCETFNKTISIEQEHHLSNQSKPAHGYGGVLPGWGGK